MFDRILTLHKKRKFCIKDFSSYIYWRNLQWKTSFFVQCKYAYGRVDWYRFDKENLYFLNNSLYLVSQLVRHSKGCYPIGKSRI